MPAPTLFFSYLFPHVPCYTGLCIHELVKARDHTQTSVIRFLGVRLALEVKKDQDQAAPRAYIAHTRVLG